MNPPSGGRRTDLVKTRLRLAPLAVLAACAVSPVCAWAAGGTSYTGNFATDDAQQTFAVTLAQTGPLTIRTYSYAGGTNQAGVAVPAGGFDPTVSVFDGQGNLLVTNRDGGCGQVAADPVSGFCWDSYLALTLPAGSYSVVLTQSENLPGGPTLASSFVYTGQTTFTTPPGESSPGFWDLFPSKRTSAYAIDILGGVSTVTAITSSSTLPAGGLGFAYSPFTFTANAAAGATLIWTISAGALPTGMGLNPSTGVLSGTPQVAGTFPITVQVTDGALPVVTQSLSLVVLGPPVVSAAPLQSGTYGQFYGPFNLSATGGSGSYSWSGSGFPSNVTVSANGVLSGTPNQGGSFPVVISAYDMVTGLTGSANLTLVIAIPTLSITNSGSLGGFIPGGKISGTFVASGGIPNYMWSATGLPAGLSLNGTTGAYSGTGGNPGVYNFTIQVTDSESPVAATASLSVTYSVLGITTSALPNGSTTSAYSASLAATGGTGSYSFTAMGLPMGLSLSPSGAFSGTPGASGTFTVLVQVSSGGLSTSSTFALVVTAPATQPLAVSAATLPAATVSVPYPAGTGLQASGGSPPYMWSVFGGVLPGGMSISAAGNLIGTPSLAGSYVFTAQVTDATGATATGTFTLVVNPAPPALTLGTFPNGVVGVNYPVQILTSSVSGGTPPYTFALANGTQLPGGLMLMNQEISGMPGSAGTTTFTIAATDTTGKTVNAPGTIIIGSATTLILSQSTVSFALTAGAGGVPTPASVTISSSDSSTQLGYSFSVAPAVSWLHVTSGATTPGGLAISVDETAPSLPASATPYSTLIGVTCSCGGPVQYVAVSLTVSAPPPLLSLSSSLLTFIAFSSSPVASSQTLVLQNAGGGEIDISSITTGSTWLTVTGVPGELTAGPGASVTVTADPTGLSPGYYTTALTVNSPQGNVSIPVTLLITPELTMTLGPAGAQFSAPAGSSPGVPGGSFSVIAAGTGTVTWTAALLPGANWITLNTTSGSSSATSSQSVSYSLSAGVIAGLAPATYYATIVISAPNAADTQQQYEVVLNVTAANAAVNPVLSTGGLIFTSGPAGTTAAQNVLVYTSAVGSTPYQAAAATTDGAPWLLVSPMMGSATVLSAGQSAVSVNVAGLAPGIYSGGVSYSFSSAAVSTVNVTLLVLTAGGVPAARTDAHPETTAGCTASKLVGTQTGLYSNFAQPAGWPTPLSVNLMDNCGSPVNGASVTTTFSNGDPPMALSPRDSTSGIYLGTWTPRNPAPQVTVTATGMKSPFAAATTQITGQVRTNTAPILTPGGTLDVFNPVVGAGLAPGQVVQIYGSALATQTMLASVVPLPISLAGTQVLIGGIAMPLYYVSPTQIDAQVPFQLTPGTQYQILVEVNGALSTPAPVQIVSAAPGICNIGGGVVAQHAIDYSLVTPASPAVPGEYLIIYLSGMGATNNAVATGSVTPGSPLSNPLTTATLTLNGVPVSLANGFVGLTPSAVGLYQINFQVPANAPAGNLALSVSQGGATSNAVTLPVQ